MKLFVGHDIGTGAVKSVLIDAAGRLRARRTALHELAHPHPAWAEQDPEAWWRGVAECTRGLLSDSGAQGREVEGIAFAGQMLSLVALDARGVPLRPAITWMDGRAEDEARALVRRFGGERAVRWIAGGSPTGKDLVPKMRWIEAHEPLIYARTAAFTDATGCLVARATGRIAMDPCAAGATGLFDARTRRWSRLLAIAAGARLRTMAPIVECAAIAGVLRADAARDLGLREGVPVAMGLADVPSGAVGAGAMEPGQAHVYLGTSAWIGVTSRASRGVPRAGIAALPAFRPGTSLLVGESETAGACRDWLARVVFEGRVEDAAIEAMLQASPPGARGLLFVPWMYGERSPVPDARVRGAFVNLSLEHRREDLARAVHEGVALNLRWIADELSRTGEGCEMLRAIGGGASDAWLQILADATGRRIERVASPRHAGAIGVALIAAAATGAVASVRDAAARVSVERVLEPDPRRAGAYDAPYAALRELRAPLARIGARNVRASEPS